MNDIAPKRDTADVTVAIACFNQGHFLRDSIESALNQSQSPSAIILVDDGSDDETKKIAGSFSGVHYIWQERSGLSSARNSALAAATTKYILFLDADDVLRPTAIEQSTKCIEQTDDAAFVHGGYQKVDCDRNILSTHQASESQNSFIDLLKGNYIAMHGTVLYNAEILRKSGGFDTTLPSCEDFDVYLRLARYHPIAAYSCLAAEYRLHDSNMSWRGLRMIATASRVIRQHARSFARDSAEAEAARFGIYFMTDFYTDQLLENLVKAKELGYLRSAIRRLLEAAIKDPSGFLGFVRSAYRRSARTVTVTG